MDGSNQRIEYKTKSLSESKLLSDSSKGSFPSQFDNYINAFNLYSTGDVCFNFYGNSTGKKILLDEFF